MAPRPRKTVDRPGMVPWTNVDLDDAGYYETAEEWEDASSGDDSSFYEDGDGDGDDGPSRSQDWFDYEKDISDKEDDVGGSESGINVEKSIEGDFSRLVDSIKKGDAVGSGSGSVWDVSIQEAEGFDIQEELRNATGIGRRTRRRGPNDQPVLSQQVKALLGEANTAYVSRNVPETIRLMQEVIRIEPREPSAWTTLALCYSDINEPEKALKLNIIGAHLFHDVDKWIELGKESRDWGYLQQALYCYRKACTLDPGDVNAQWERASVSKELGDLKTAKTAFLSILKRYPHNVSALEEIRPILVELSEVPHGIQLYQEAFDYYQETYPTGNTVDASGAEIPGGGFGDIQIIVLADFYNSVGDPGKTVATIRKGARWLQGRADQRQWDNEADDREFDVSSVTRGDQIAGKRIAGYPLDLNFRHRLAVARLMLGDHEEGKMHSRLILQNDAREHAVLFTEIADAMFDQGLYEDALAVYETLSADEATSGYRIVFQAAACQRNMGNLREAAEVYEHVLSGNPDHVDAKMKLAEIYEAMNEPRKALNLVYDVIDARRKDVGRADSADGGEKDNTLSQDSLFEEKTARAKKKVKHGMSLAQLQALELEHEAEAKRGFEALEKLAPDMKKGDPVAEVAWLTEAEKLVESFREVKPLFPSTRIEFRGMPAWRRAARKARKDAENVEDAMASRLQLELEYDKVASQAKKKAGEKVTEFRCISFDDWLLLFVEYAFLLTKRGQYPLADEVLRHAMQSVVFQERPMDTLRLALITCAVYVKEYETVVAMCRKLINRYQFNNEPPRLLLATLASGLLSVDAFIDSRLQKHISREVKLADAVVKGREVRWNSHNRRYHLVGVDEGAKDEGDEPDDNSPDITAPDKPTKHNPVMICIYGQLCVAARSYQSAIFYLLHAYEYQPNDPVICLSLAVAYLGRSMQRQTDNRHYMIAESLAFLSRYRDIRTRDQENVDEVEFNFGRAFHQIGLFHYAKKHYERVLTNTEARLKRDPSDVGLSREAAYNLSLVYMSTGAKGLVKELYRKWLSI